jgi:hypothetical protein
MTDAEPSLDPLVTPDVVAEHGLTPEEFERIKKILGRKPKFHRARDFLSNVERALLLQKSKIVRISQRDAPAKKSRTIHAEPCSFYS